MTRPTEQDPDERAIRHASRVVGLQIAGAATILVIAVVVVAFAFVLDHIKPDRLFSHHEATIDIGGLDIIEGAVIIGVAAVVLAAALSWFATRRAVRPLGQALRSQRAFVANASHELRTPLAVLDARLQTLQRRLSDDDPSAATVDLLRRDAATLVQIVNDLLEAAEDGPRSSGPVPAGPVVELAVESMQLLAADRGITIGLAVSDDVTVQMAPAGLHRCVVALVDNAVKYSPDGSHVDVALRAAGGWVELAVTDHGTGIVGIPPAQVFDRFVRGADAEAHPGFGIGLALVRDTVERAGGSARIETTGSTGTTIVLRVPGHENTRRRRR